MRRLGSWSAPHQRYQRGKRNILVSQSFPLGLLRQRCNASCSRMSKALENDYYISSVHGPQLPTVRHFTGPRNAKWIWRCHIDSSAPDKVVSLFLRPYLEKYDAVVFTMADFLLIITTSCRSSHKTSLSRCDQRSAQFRIDSWAMINSIRPLPYRIGFTRIESISIQTIPTLIDSTILTR